MSRYKLLLEYDGHPFIGWQWQRIGVSIQQVLQQAVEKFCGRPADVHAAGRTDAGVHALGQCAHVDIDKDTTADVVRSALNFHCKPWPISVLSAEVVPESFHARFSAIGRRYRYRIVNRHAPLTVDLHRAWLVKYPLDADAMHRAAQILVGHHDFSGFRSSMCQAKSPLRTLERLDVTRHGQDIVIEADARSFLHNQVRIMVGTLKRLGEGKFTEEGIHAALSSGQRKEAGPTAPPDGLYLTEVVYPKSAE